MATRRADPGPAHISLAAGGQVGAAAAAGLVGVGLVATLAVGYFAHRAGVADTQRRAVEQRAALERTAVAAMGGRFDDAEQDLEQAAALGASRGEILLWRGQIALYRGKTQEALKDLEVAAQLLPNSVAAQAILLRAYHDVGQFYWLRVDSFLRHRRLFAPQTAPLILPEWAVQDIDNENDWVVAETKFEVIQRLGLRATPESERSA